MAYAYYPVIPCGQQSSIAFISNERIAGYPGFFIRFLTGVPAEFLGVCYHVDPGASDTLIDTTIVWPPSLGPATYETFTTCEACGIAATPPFPPNYITYQFDACCGGTPLIYSFLTPSTIVEGGVYSYTGPSVGPLVPGCYTLTRIESITPFPFVDEGDLKLQPTCAEPICQAFCNPCECYTFTAGSIRTTVTALDCDGNTVTIVLASNEISDKMCLSGIIDAGTATFNLFGLCSDINGEPTCPGCYTLTDCQGIVDPITSVNQSLAPYAGTGQSIQIEGSDTCWTVTLDEVSDCPCAINVTIQFEYINCTDCLTPKGYKLTECTTLDVIYTTSDLSTYVGLTVEIDCGGCWTVEELDIPPPSNQPVIVTNSYTDCPACNATYYTLIKCGDGTNIIYTVTDLSALVGQYITLQFCPGECWKVIEGGQEGGIILPENAYATCSECMLANNTCQCQTVTNNVGAGRRFNYYDCSGTLLFTPPLALGVTTAKTCMLSFTNANPDDVINYGDCTLNVCPPEPSPILYRAVTPGYGTAACTTEYYETVECAFSEWMYKDVLEQRYGIANCCPDELMRWEIKHEMLMLDILVNPNYVCQGVNGCGCNTTFTPPPPCNS
jgi:hypothetical protein